MAPPSLVKLALLNANRGIKHIKDVGDAPYTLVEPILKNIKDPAQLREIEIASPQICTEDKALWIKFLSKFTAYKKTPVTPKNSQTWFELFQKFEKEDRELRKKQEAALKAAFTTKSDEKAKNTVTFIEKAPVQVKTRVPRTKNESRESAKPKISSIDKIRRDVINRRNAVFGVKIGGLFPAQRARMLAEVKPCTPDTNTTKQLATPDKAPIFPVPKGVKARPQTIAHVRMESRPSTSGSSAGSNMSSNTKGSVDPKPSAAISATINPSRKRSAMDDSATKATASTNISKRQKI